MVGHWIKVGLASVALMGLAACEEAITSPRPAARVAPPVDTAPPPPVAPSERSMALASYYASVERSLVSQGLLRRDGGGPDTPFSKRDLVENFIRIGVFNEFTFEGGSFSDRTSEGSVQRWGKPVRVGLEFGPAVAEGIRQDSRTVLQRYVRRLSRITGQPMSLGAPRPNFTVAVLTVDEIEAFGPRLLELFPGLPPSVAAQIITVPRPIYCTVYAFSDSDRPNQIHSAVAIIRAEHPKRLRDSCIHEEVSQGLGLSNDSPAARPSIFNDDDEFGLLTRHDELLLEILYDDRLPLGATPAEARPVVEVIASELLGGES